MPVQPSAPPPLISGTGIVRGNAKKTYSSNLPIISALLLSEIIQQGLPGLGAIPVAYRLVPGGQAAKKAYLISAVATVLEYLWVAFPNPPVITSGAAAIAIVQHFGQDVVVEAIDNSSTAGLGPDSGYLYVLENKTLDISAGQYSIDSVYRIPNGETFINQPTRENFDYIDWFPGIPNLSWLGDWFEYDDVTSSVGNNAIIDQYTQPEFELDTGNNYSGSQNNTSTQKGNFAPIALATAGFFVAGPLGAAIGFGIGSLAK